MVSKVISGLKKVGEAEYKAGKRAFGYLKKEAPVVAGYIKKEAPKAKVFLEEEALKGTSLGLSGLIYAKQSRLNELNEKEKIHGLSDYEKELKEKLVNKINKYKSLQEKAETAEKRIEKEAEAKKSIEYEKLNTVLGEYESAM